jgi:hypothetical protein
MRMTSNERRLFVPELVAEVERRQPDKQPSPVFGYVAIDVASGNHPTGLSIIDLRSAGTLVNEVSVPIPPVGLVGRLYLSTVAGATTAITMVNPNNEDTRVDFYFHSEGWKKQIRLGTSHCLRTRRRPAF